MAESSFNRRTFLGWAGLSLLVLAADPFDAFAKKSRISRKNQRKKNAASNASSQPTRYDVSYSWHNQLEDALDYMEELRSVLGDGLGEELGSIVQRKIRIVRSTQSGLYGIIYNMNSENIELCRALAADHSSILKESVLKEKDLEPAECVGDTGYNFLYNVCYGLGRNLEELKRVYSTVSTMLGQGVTRNLVIEKTLDGNYALVYKRYDTLESTARIAEHHAKLLAEKGIGAAQRLENNDEIVFGESSMLNEEREYKKRIQHSQKKKSSVHEQKEIKKYKENKHQPPQINEKDNNTLEASVEKYISSLRKRRFLQPDEKTSFVIYDLKANETLVSINEDVPMQAASMVKPLAALAFFHRVEKGELKYGLISKANMEAMIQRSRNSATNWVMQQVGGPEEVQRILHENYEDIFKQTSVVEYIPAGGRTYLNKASAHDYSRFMFALWHGKLPYSSEMKRLMALPNRDRIYTGASHVPEGTIVYDKTGSTSQCCGDFGILVTRKQNPILPGRFPYIIVGIIEKPSGADSYKSWIKSRGDIIREVSNMAHDEMSKRYNL
ncbi:serine hydrolase [Candidatus Woesearchaeota archaeon]|nr:serine hydrolase [Candidatus Woesearchaeota archaeon]